MTFDPGTHRLYLPTAEFAPPAPNAEGPGTRPVAVPGTFEVLIMSR